MRPEVDEIIKATNKADFWQKIITNARLEDPKIDAASIAEEIMGMLVHDRGIDFKGLEGEMFDAMRYMAAHLLTIITAKIKRHHNSGDARPDYAAAAKRQRALVLTIMFETFMKRTGLELRAYRYVPDTFIAAIGDNQRVEDVYSREEALPVWKKAAL